MHFGTGWCYSDFIQMAAVTPFGILQDLHVFQVRTILFLRYLLLPPFVRMQELDHLRFLMLQECFIP